MAFIHKSFWALKAVHQKLKLYNLFGIIQFNVQVIAFKLCTKQSASGKSREGKRQEGKQLKFAP